MLSKTNTILFAFKKLVTGNNNICQVTRVSYQIKFQIFIDNYYQLFGI